MFGLLFNFSKEHLTLLFILMCGSALLTGVTQGYISSVTFMSILKRAEERAATYVILITNSLVSFIGIILQLFIVLSISTIFLN